MIGKHPSKRRPKSTVPRSHGAFQAQKVPNLEVRSSPQEPLPLPPKKVSMFRFKASVPHRNVTPRSEQSPPVERRAQAKRSCVRPGRCSLTLDSKRKKIDSKNGGSLSEARHEDVKKSTPTS